MFNGGQAVFILGFENQGDYLKGAFYLSVVRWTDRLNMAIAVDWDVKNQTKIFAYWKTQISPGIVQSDQSLHWVLCRYQ